MSNSRFDIKGGRAGFNPGRWAGWMLWVALAAWLGGARAASAADTVIISEFVASNVGGLVDEDLDSSDWLELYNFGNSAVNLSGWFLTDDTNNLAKWAFPATTLSARGFLIVFASGKDRATNGAPLHTSFQLNSDGGQLALVHGTTIVSQFAPAYPGQRANYSYGLVQNVTINKLVNGTAPARVLVPSSGALGLTWTDGGFDDSAWLAATNGVGYETSVPGFRVRNFKANVVVDTLAKAETVITNASQQTSVVSTNSGVVNFSDQAGDGHYGSNLAFPGQPAASAVDDFVLEVTATITIPSAGQWSFGVNSDDGFRLTIGSQTVFYDPPRGPADTLGTLTFATPGDYPLRLVYYERGGGAEVELYAAPGNATVWGNNFKLVGDQANGGLVVRSLPVSGGTGLGYRDQISTDIQSQMLSNNATAYLRFPFNVANTATLTSLYLEMKYDDGFVAYLNGTEVARRNASGVPQFNSAATSAHLGSSFEEINLSDQLGLLHNGNNLLAIQGLNESADNSDFFIAAELWDIQANATGTNLFFSTPTPGTFNNTPSFNGFVGDTHFTVDRGFFDTPFSLAITSSTAGATIRYTLNGSVPALTNGLTYTSPLLVSNTSTLRAAAFMTGLVPSDVDCQTYIFVDDVIRQSPTGAPPPGWPASWGANVVDYGMDPDIVNSTTWANEVKPALKSLPTFSIVMNLNDLFNPTTGIYANPSGDEIAWERPGSLELIYPDGKKGFQINCGVRLRGGFSRDVANPKHAFRFFFRQEYGAAKLKFPIFGSDGADEFNKIDLRTMQNYSWAYQNDARMICLRDQLARDAQLDMGDASSHGIFCHLYINGQYWGLYNTDERPEANFGESYFGGRAEDYDTVKVDPDLGYNIEPTDGVLDAYMRLWMVCTNNSISDVLFYQLQGLNVDGTPNPAYENLLDVSDLINYMLIAYYGGNLDAPISNFLSNTSPNNFFGFRNRLGVSGGFKYVMHDSEHTLLDVTQNRLGPSTGIGWPAGSPANAGGFLKASPQYFFQQLLSNLEFKMAVADKVQKHFFNGGVLTPEFSRAHFLVRSNEIYRAIVAESARWGDAKRTVPFNRNDWVAAMNTVYGYFGARTANVVQQLRTWGWFPQLSAPLFSRYGGIVSNGFSLYLTNVSAGSTLYYTTDGTDPRLRGGMVSGLSSTYSAGTPIPINFQTTVRARVLSGTNWSAISEAVFYTGQDFGKLIVSEIMYNPPAIGIAPGDEFEFIELKNTGPNVLDLSGLKFSSGITFTFTNGTRLNPGQFFVIGRNEGQLTTNKYPGLSLNGVYGGKLDNDGEKITLSHPLAGVLLSFTYNDGGRWPIAPDGQNYSIVPRNPDSNPDPGNPTSWRASTNPGGSPGSDDPVSTIPGVIINEVLAHSTFPDVDKIELHNPTVADVNLKGWYLTDNSNIPRKFRFNNDTVILAGGYMVLTEADFNPTPGTNNSFSLEGGGEEIYLLSGDPGSTNLTGYSHGFSFDASPAGATIGRYTTSPGDDHFVLLTSPSLGGTNSGPLIGPVVIRQVMYHPPDLPGLVDDTANEYVELVNRSGAPVPLFDPMATTNAWHLRGGVNYDFPSGFTLGAGSNVVLVSFPPNSPSQAASFRGHFGLFANTPLFGPWSGKLDNSTDTVEIRRPDVPDTNGVAYIPVDKVEYKDLPPWPVGPDGTGAALTRVVLSSFGNEPTNWSAITPLTIIMNPTNLSSKPTSNVTFSVMALGTPPLTYQWRLNGGNLANGGGYGGVTTTTLSIANVQPMQAGDYTVAITDASGTAYSLPATLSVLVAPVILIPPQSMTVVQGDLVTLGVLISNYATFPVTYEWRIGSTPVQTYVVNSLTNSYTFPAIGTNTTVTNNYRVVIKNPANTAPGVPSAFAAIGILLDSDGDHIPDIWEIQYGLGTNNAADGALDLDEDGMSNLAEYRSGTDPTNPLSYLHVEEVIGSPDALSIRFTAVSNRTYTVQYTDVIPIPNAQWASWTNIAAATTNRVLVLTNSPIGDARRYYRLVTPQAP